MTHYLVLDLIFIRNFRVGFAEDGLKGRSTFIIRAYATRLTDKSVSCSEGRNLLTRRC